MYEAPVFCIHLFIIPPRTHHVQFSLSPPCLIQNTAFQAVMCYAEEKKRTIQLHIERAKEKKKDWKKAGDSGIHMLLSFGSLMCTESGDYRLLCDMLSKPPQNSASFLPHNPPSLTYANTKPMLLRTWPGAVPSYPSDD